MVENDLWFKDKDKIVISKSDAPLQKENEWLKALISGNKAQTYLSSKGVRVTHGHNKPWLISSKQRRIITDGN